MTTKNRMTSRESRWLAALIMAAFAVRVIYCWKFPQWGPGGSIPDLNWYETIAESLFRHGDITNPTGCLTAAREPGYPMLLAGMYLFTGPSYRAGQALNCVFGTLTVWLIFSLGRAVFEKRTAWLAAGIAAFYPQFLYYTSTLERETIQTFLLTLTAWLLVRGRQNGYADRSASWRPWAAAGLAAACCALTNSVFLPTGLALASVAWLIGRRKGRENRRWAAVYLTAFLCLYALWPLRNVRVFHRFIPGIAFGGGHLYLGILVPNNVAGTPGEAKFLENDPVNLEAKNLSEAERDIFFYRASFRFMREHPAKFALIAARSLAKLWRLYPYARSYAYNYRLIKWVGLLSDGWIIPMGFLGMLLAGRRFPETDYFYCIILTVSFTYMIFWSIVRYRLPMMPFVILFCAYAATRLLYRWGRVRIEQDEN